ncbi:MAG: hypothetical protein FJ293_02650 [Planctomycetes bacterium]|nr:hypothetical protein [Planctomycetota bacterium]
MRLLETDFRLTPELVVDAWMQEPSGRPVVVLGEGNGGAAVALGRAWCVIAEVRRMRNLLERLFRQEGTRFDVDPRVIVIAARFPDALLGVRDRLAACAIDLVEAVVVEFDASPRLVLVPAGGALLREAPPAPDLPVAVPVTAPVAVPAAAPVAAPPVLPVASRANGNGNGHGNGHGNGNGGHVPAGAARPVPRAVGVAALLDELKRKVVHLNDHVAEEVDGTTTRFRFHGELLAAVTASDAGLRVAIGDDGEAERVVGERTALNSVLDDVVRRYFALARLVKPAGRATGGAASAGAARG